MTGRFRKIWDLFETGNAVPVCAWCGRVRVDGEWDWPPTGAISAIEPTSLTHSICTSCAAAQAQARATATQSFD